jgi:hypothetical protein
MDYRYEAANGECEFNPAYLKGMARPIKVFKTNDDVVFKFLNTMLDIQMWLDQLRETGLMASYNANQEEVLELRPQDALKKPNEITFGHAAVSFAKGEDVKKDHINPSHYQGYINIPEIELELQWLESMQYLPRFRNPEVFIGALELQGRKYWDRNGGKDEEVQELTKGIWYFKFLIAYIKNGCKPIRVADINALIGDMGQGTMISENAADERIAQMHQAFEDKYNGMLKELQGVVGKRDITIAEQLNVIVSYQNANKEQAATIQAYQQKLPELNAVLNANAKELDLLRRYVVDTAQASNPEWPQGEYSDEEMDVLRKIAKL